jgi:hypothetical protein
MRRASGSEPGVAVAQINAVVEAPINPAKLFVFQAAPIAEHDALRSESFSPTPVRRAIYGNGSRI